MQRTPALRSSARRPKPFRPKTRSKPSRHLPRPSLRTPHLSRTAQRKSRWRIKSPSIRERCSRRCPLPPSTRIPRSPSPWNQLHHPTSDDCYNPVEKSGRRAAEFFCCAPQPRFGGVVFCDFRGGLKGFQDSEGLTECLGCDANATVGICFSGLLTPMGQFVHAYASVVPKPHAAVQRSCAAARLTPSRRISSWPRVTITSPSSPR